MEKGWISHEIQPADQRRPGLDGVLRLVLVGNPPLIGSPEANMPANPQVDQLTVALPISTIQLSRIREIQIRSASGGVKSGSGARSTVGSVGLM